MEKTIAHRHQRHFRAPRQRVTTSIDALWSGQPDDALPRLLRGWRRTMAGASGLAVGTRFGHGPFEFTVEQWDGHALRARIDTAGFRGYHGFTLEDQGAEVMVTHDLDAELDLAPWLIWRALIAASHDWAVESMFDRMQELLDEAQSQRTMRPPIAMRMFIKLRRLFASVDRPVTR